ncbi:hypothetical protein DXC92_20960 [Clostridiales bacterium TF09-2AC]|nr:hypothetical protein DXC92_20960 [Clostridiales bacterium TF09-2AC]
MSGYDRGDDAQMDKSTVEVFPEALSQGEDMECLPEWGRFIPKLRENPGQITKGGNAEWKRKHAGYHFPE